MTKLLPALALAAFLQDAPKATIEPGDPTDKVWPVSGTANASNETQVVAAARRCDSYSARSASSGGIRAARRAGSQAASSPTDNSSRVTTV